MTTTAKRTVFRTCTLCEASCGLAFDVEGDRITAVRPDPDDVFSRGHVCPKGPAMAAVHHDPDRLRNPLRRDASGGFVPVGWDEALDLAARRLREIRAEHGADAVATYVGNPIVHDTGALLLRGGLQRALGTRNSFSAGTQDTSVRNAASFHLYGNSWVVPIPDVDRTDFFLCVGANPYVSNGSFWSVPGVRARIRGVRARGGRVVVVDPRRTETAREADEHVSVLPGGDAALLLAMVRVLVDHGLVDRARLRRVATGWDEIERRLAPFTPERAAAVAGVPAETIERLALEFAAARSSVAYSRIGVCNARFGTLACYATDLLNLAAGRLGEPGGAVFPKPAIDLPDVFALVGDGQARWRSRVRGLPETIGDLPSAALAEEIETPGPGRIRALLTFAGNPVLSVPNGRRLEAALAKLDFQVSIDLYVNETTRHADLILPPAWSLAEDHLDVLFPTFAHRNVARWSPPVVERAADERADWEILLGLVERLGGGPTGMPWMDRAFALARRFGWRWTPTGAADLFLRTGRRGDRFLPFSRGLSARKLRAAPHGIDLGPVEPGFAHRLYHRDRRIHLAAEPFVAELVRAAAELDRPPAAGELVLVGRREIRTNNSWMHNVPALVSGRERCTLLVHPADAARAGVRDGELASLESRVHRGAVRVRVSDEMRPGVVSLPHGWGHAGAPGLRVASARPGVSANDWTDDSEVEPVAGQSILNGVRVRLRALEQPAAEPRVA